MSQYYQLTIIIVWLGGRQRTVFTRDITTIGELRWILAEDLDYPVEDIGLMIAGDTLEDSDMLDWIDGLDDPAQMLVAYSGALVINAQEEGDVSEHESEESGDELEGESEDKSGDESEAE